MIKNKNVIYGASNILVPAKLNFGEFILERMKSFQDKICLINGLTDEQITYSQIVQQAMNVAVSLFHLGVRKGHTVAIVSENRTEFFPAAIGTICAGAALTTANFSYTKGELQHVLNITKPSVIFCSPLAYKTHAQSIKSLNFIKTIILFGDSTPDTISFSNLAFAKDFRGEISQKNGKIFDAQAKVLLRNVLFEEFESPEIRGQDDTAVILYSSGTTGLPKGVMLTHLNLLTACCLPVSTDPRMLGLTITPWFHVYGLIGNFVVFNSGRTAVYLPKFDVEQYLKVVEKYKVAMLTVVPPVLVALCKSKLNYDVTSVQMIYSGAAPLHKETLLAAKNKFPNARVLQGYGMTEATLGVTRDTYDSAHFIKPGSVGRVVPGTIIKVADLETGKALGTNQPGEICLRGPLVMKGYVGKPIGADMDSEGFFKTGDIGFYDEDGCFYIVDRLKELIKYKAYQVPPAEIEAVLLQHPAVKDAGVVGLEHPTAGEVPLAFVEKQPGVEVSEEELKAFVAEKLSNPKHLRGGVRFVAGIPKNPSGKILRKVLREMAKEGKSKL